MSTRLPCQKPTATGSTGPRYFYPIFLAATLAAYSLASAAEEGLLPLGADGKPLNLDFEQGSLKDWTASGEAFEKQPVRGNTVTLRREDMKSEHQGNYWIGTFEKHGDKPQGTLTSAPFKLTARFASFLLGGGSHANTRVELVRADNQQVIYKSSGPDGENMRPVVADLQDHEGKKIFIRLVDQESGGWGHINFDNFRLYAERPKPANELIPAKVEMPPVDALKFAGLSPEEAAKQMTLPPGFKATLFAGEPDVKQPIAFALDHRGRLWVAEAYTYPLRAPEGKGKDRIVVFEDTDGDGKFNRRTVFIQGLNLVSGLEVGFGGVWVGAAPYLLFIPIADGDEPKPAGPAKTLLDGWAHQDTHETLNTFTWGPDGWLYGCHGVFTHSNVGKPGAPDSERTRINAGVFRYHPTKHLFEVFAEGSSNPWGVDFDEHGQCFIEACVIPHLFHMIQGGRYHRQAGSHFNPHIYDDIKTVADHVHWAGNKGPHAGNARSGAAGGGHAHAGLLIYQGDNWPEKYRGQLFMNNIHGARLNMDTPKRQGSGFVGQHNPDFAEFNDKWSQVLNLITGPDGGVYVIDWYDKNECHHNDANGHDRSNGRIFKITYSDPALRKSPLPKDLTQESDANLLMHQLQMDNGTARDNWLARHARRILQERAQSGNLKLDFDKQLAGLAKPLNQNQSLRVLWSRHATTGLTETVGLRELKSEHEYVRAWTIQLLCEAKQISPGVMKEFVRLAREDTSAVVRLYLAAALQRLPVEQRWEVVENLYGHAEDAGDHNLPLMVWYAAEPLPTLDAPRALLLAQKTSLPNLLNFTVRRTAAVNTPEAFAAITAALERATGDAQQLDILNGLSFALKGRRSAPMPNGWAALEGKLGANPNAELRAQVQALSLTFGSSGALSALKKTLADKSADPTARRTAYESLLGAKDPGLPVLLQDLLGDPDLRGPALRGLAAYDDAKTPSAILAVYAALNETQKRDALNTLVSRVPFARELLTAVSSGLVPKQDLTAELVRQLRNLKAGELDDQIVKVWGVMRESAADKQKEIAKYRDIYRAGGSQPGEASRGRAVFAKVCQQCHVLFDTGGKVGPDLTGSNRGDLDYILQNIIDPNAVIPNDYRAWNLDTKDERAISGILKQQDEKAVTLVTATETIVVPRNEIQSLKEGQLSMMPEGLLQPLADQEVRDLIYYLRGPGQAPLPATSETAAAFFNGKDLTGWDGDLALWKVENGEIVARSATGLKHNEFLKNQLALEDFRLVLKVKLVPNKENSGVQFRSERFGDYEMKGPQADIGSGWWGKLYEENGRALLWNKPGDAFVNAEQWNTYEILAVGSKVRTAINGQLCVDVDDPKISRRGVIALQAHSGGPLEVRFKELQLELNPKFELRTAK